MLLVMGIGAQLVTWPEGFCDLLAARGYRLIASTTATPGARHG